MNKTKQSKWVAILLALCMLSGCTTVPVEQFEAYKRAFDHVRASGEDVLLDYGVAKSDYKKIRQEAATGEGQVNTSERLAFDINAITETGIPPDDVVERMYAWNVLAQYNEILTAVARGHSPEEVSYAVDGLAETLRKFPIKEISEVGAELAPCASVVKAALEIVEREIAVGRFKESIRTIYPAINEFLYLLERDAQNFYNIRLGLHDLVYESILDQIADTEDAFQDLLAGFNISTDTGDSETTHRIYPLIKQVNDTLAGIPDWPSENIIVMSQSGGEEYSDLAHSQFFDMASEIKRLTAEAKTVDDELLAYRNVLIKYVNLILQTRLALKEVVEAIEEKRQPEAVAQNMFDAAIKLKRAIAEYEKAR